MVKDPMPFNSQLSHPYLPQTENQIQTMLNTIGVSSIEELFSSIPKKLIHNGRLNQPEPHSEQEVIARVKMILEQNQSTDESLSLLGAGLYYHFIPAVVSTIINRSEFYTSYTPYAPEVSQGMLQALWEYQSLIAALTKLDIVNSSMYDMATALGEAALMCTRVTKKEIFLVPSYIQPERFQTLKTYAQGSNIQLRTFSYDPEIGTVDFDSLQKIAYSQENKISGIYIEQPNFWGVIEEKIKRVGDLAHELDALFVVGIDPISLGLLKAPGDYGADIAIGEGQSLGLPMNFGGPLLGLFAVKNDMRFVRAMPGRIIGLTTEKKSKKRAFTMTLQTREQHIRRERATSNICTNNALCALASAVYLSLLGLNGIKQLAEINIARASYLVEELDSINGITAPHFSGQHFREFVFTLEDKYKYKEFESFLVKNKVHIGFSLQDSFPELGQACLSAATEMINLNDIDEIKKKILLYFSNDGGH